jgi:RNA polymerase sigma-70 factor (ECF subfamily)
MLERYVFLFFYPHKGFGKSGVYNGNIATKLDLLENLKSVHNELAIEVEQYFQEYFEGLRRYACTLLRDEDEAKDAVQAIFLKLWEKGERLDRNLSIKSYLYTSVYNHCLNVKRHQKVKERHLAAGKHQTYEMEDPTAQKENSLQIMATLEGLPPRCRQVFIMSRLEEKKYSEIAAEMGISVKTVEVQMGKALKLLRKKFL